MDLIIIPDELEDSDVEAAGEGYAILCHANGVVLYVWAPTEGHMLKEFVCISFFHPQADGFWSLKTNLLENLSLSEDV